jgi:hypothetical protein
MAKLPKKLTAGLASAPVRRGVIAAIGGVCVGLTAWGVGLSWQPKTRAPTAPAPSKPLIVDGPPTDVPPAPTPPPRPAPSDRLASAADDDGESPDGPPPAEAASEAAPPTTEGLGQAAPTPAAARGFEADNCSALPSPADRLVCASPNLAAADLRLRRLYSQALDESPDAEGLRDDQRLWDRDRDRVATLEGPQGLARLYDERIQELSGPG